MCQATQKVCNEKSETKKLRTCFFNDELAKNKKNMQNVNKEMLVSLTKNAYKHKPTIKRQSATKKVIAIGIKI